MPPIITSLKTLSVSNALITVSPADPNNSATSVTQDIIWSNKTNNMQETVQNVMTIASHVSINPPTVFHANQDSSLVLPVSVLTKIT